MPEGPSSIPGFEPGGIDPARYLAGSATSDAGRPRRSWIFYGLMFYAAYVGLCFAMEATARRHFPAAATTATAPAPASRREQLHAQLHRMETDNARESWPPYAVYTGVTVVLSLLGGIAGAYLGARWAWRSSGKLSVFRMKLVALGCILGMNAGYLLFYGPAELAKDLLAPAPASAGVPGP